ncbi:hypothetical protein, partial [Vreelandella maris]|uniref:hypothetical protein n=1 Tax=Vreelandella maris TaxID=2729617 RepID=UPI0030EBC690
MEDGSSVGTTNTDELFLFSQTESDQSATISFEDADQLYIGNQFTFNADIEGGDNSVLEVFFV